MDNIQQIIKIASDSYEKFMKLPKDQRFYVLIAAACIIYVPLLVFVIDVLHQNGIRRFFMEEKDRRKEDRTRVAIVLILSIYLNFMFALNSYLVLFDAIGTLGLAVILFICWIIKKFRHTGGEKLNAFSFGVVALGVGTIVEFYISQHGNKFDYQAIGVIIGISIIESLLFTLWFNLVDHIYANWDLVIDDKKYPYYFRRGNQLIVGKAEPYKKDEEKSNSSEPYKATKDMDYEEEFYVFSEDDLKDNMGKDGKGDKPEDKKDKETEISSQVHLIRRKEPEKVKKSEKEKDTQLKEKKEK